MIDHLCLFTLSNSVPCFIMLRRLTLTGKFSSKPIKQLNESKKKKSSKKKTEKEVADAGAKNHEAAAARAAAGAVAGAAFSPPPLRRNGSAVVSTGPPLRTRKQPVEQYDSSCYGLNKKQGGVNMTPQKSRSLAKVNVFQNMVTTQLSYKSKTIESPLAERVRRNYM